MLPFTLCIKKDNDKTYLPDIIALQETPAAGGRANFSAMLRDTLAANGGENGAAGDLDFSALLAGGDCANGLNNLPALLSSRLQEIAGPRDSNEPSWGDKVFGQYGYVSIGTRHSHCGMADLLVRQDFAPQRIQVDNLPSVAAILTLTNKTKIAIASNHLAPSGKRKSRYVVYELLCVVRRNLSLTILFGSLYIDYCIAAGASEREDECRALMENLSSICDNVILIGDFNMRQKEDKKIEGLVGGGWIDAWKEGCGSNKELKFTWDSFTNLYHDNDHKFNCRFDRCYSRGDSINVSNFDLMGNIPVNGTKGDYLSDHFGLIVEITANPSAEENVKAVANRKIEGLVNDAFFQFEEGSMSKMNKPKSDLPHLEDASNKKSSADHKKLQKNHQKQTSSSGVWSSDEDIIMGSEETAHCVNGKRAMSTKTDTTTSNSTKMKSHTTTATSTNNSDSSNSYRSGSKKEQKKNEKAKKKKRNRFDSSSSSDEGFEDMKRKLREKQGKPYKKRLLPHLPNSSSDEDF